MYGPNNSKIFPNILNIFKIKWKYSLVFVARWKEYHKWENKNSLNKEKNYSSFKKKRKKEKNKEYC